MGRAQKFFLLFCGTKKDFKRLATTAFLLWLSLTGLMLFLTYQKPSLIPKSSLGFPSPPLPNNNQNIKEGICFDPKELKCKIAEQQREENVWKKTFYRKRAADFEGPVEVDTSKDESKCPELYGIAREMLNGLKVKLPHETKNTRWKFRERTNLKKLKETHLRWNHPWKQGNSKRTQELFRRYNVSAKTIKKRKIFLSYGHNCCNASKIRAVEHAISDANMDYAEALDLSSLSVPFQISHHEQLRQRKGAGYWLWKSYIILHALLYKLNDDDLLVYHDSGMYFVHDIGPLLKVCQDVKPSILTFSMTYEERMYSKRDAFILMDMDDPIVYAKGQGQRLANLIVAMKNCETIQYFMEYLAYTMDFRITSDKKNVLGQPNFEGFVGNRHDQTVHSLLSKKWGILELRDPCTCGRNGFDSRGGYASGPYKGLYVHDRKRS
jgi:hypothetical protein